MKTPTERTATELPAHRYLSPVGTTQRHYRLSPAFSCERGGFTAIVAVPAEADTFLFPADPDGEIADFEALAKVPGVIDPDAALSELGYRIHSNGDSH